jgi:SAM-dependent methyltransferase
MLMDHAELSSLLQPVGEGIRLAGVEPAVSAADHAASGLPVWVDFDHSVLDSEQTLASSAASAVRRGRRSGFAVRAIKGLLSPAKQVTRENVGRFMSLLRASSDRPSVLVIGGGTVGQGMQPLYDEQDIRLIAFDIYATGNIHFVADAHAIPLRDGAVDGVIVQAVLEHVLEPDRVAAEIWRVLKPGGLVYSETPFMQHVHEGAYDFTRYTESGHRYLFRRFELISSGVCGGPGTQLIWSIDYFARSLFRSRTVGSLAKLSCFWLQWFDRLMPDNYARDAASGFFFLGRRSDRAITPREAVGFYRGAQASPEARSRAAGASESSRS